MFPFGALHQRLSPGIISPVIPPANGMNFVDVNVGFSGTVTAGISFSTNNNGSWVMNKHHSAFGNPQFGYWIDPAASGVGDGYSIKVTITKTAGNDAYITITNPLSSFVALTENLTFSIFMSMAAPGSDIGDYTILVEIRNDTTMEIVESNFTITVSVDHTA